MYRDDIDLIYEIRRMPNGARELSNDTSTTPNKSNTQHKIFANRDYENVTKGVLKYISIAYNTL